jgi:flagellar protein FliT
MLTSQQMMSVYEEMVELTGQMVAAASNSDWDELAVLERRCAAHVQALKDNEPAAPLTGPSRQKKIEIIRTILANDRLIRELTTPWMTQLSALIGATRTQTRLVGAYGAV